MTENENAMQYARRSLAIANGGKSSCQNAIDLATATVDRALILQPDSIASVIALLTLVLESDGDGLDRPVSVAITNSVACLRNLAGSIQ